MWSNNHFIPAEPSTTCGIFARIASHLVCLGIWLIWDYYLRRVVVLPKAGDNHIRTELMAHHQQQHQQRVKDEDNDCDSSSEYNSKSNDKSNEEGDSDWTLVSSSSSPSLQRRCCPLFRAAGK